MHTKKNCKNIAPLPQHVVRPALKLAFAEDWGLSGDITSQACIPPDLELRAQLRLRGQSEYVLCGLELAQAAFAYGDSGLLMQFCQQDGAVVPAGALLAEISGRAAALLARERVALNYLGHLSGIATLTQQYVQAVAHTRAQIVDTRKTTPGLRTLEKYAVRCGGGRNHRFGLFDAAMIKDNHIAAAGGVIPALEALRHRAGHTVQIELEVDTLQQLRQIDFDNAALRPDCVLLDNMNTDQLRQAVRYVAGRAQCEASGGIRLESVVQIAETGVDLISVGALTHSAPIVDLGLDLGPV